MTQVHQRSTYFSTLEVVHSDPVHILWLRQHVYETTSAALVQLKPFSFAAPAGALRTRLREAQDLLFEAFQHDTSQSTIRELLGSAIQKGSESQSGRCQLSETSLLEMKVLDAGPCAQSKLARMRLVLTSANYFSPSCQLFESYIRHLPTSPANFSSFLLLS